MISQKAMLRLLRRENEREALKISRKAHNDGIRMLVLSNTNHIDKASRATSAFAKYPVSNTSIELYHSSKLQRHSRIKFHVTIYWMYHSLFNDRWQKGKIFYFTFIFGDYHIIAPEDKDSLITSKRSVNALHVKPFHVSGHPPPSTYANWPITGIHMAIIIEIIAPVIPIFNLMTNTIICSVTDRKEKYEMTMFLLCDWRYIWNVKLNTLEKTAGMNQMEIKPVTWEISGSWPSRRSRGDVKKKSGRMMMEIARRMIHHLWR